ncbi:hypothetical protein QYZ88_013800 [Lachnospiraceae bacterium C1.1]|nr:hypothetical protein [Lachnospiraceae bacterium C1.1]
MPRKNGLFDDVDNIEENINEANGFNPNWDELNEKEKRWNDLNRFIKEQENKKAEPNRESEPNKESVFTDDEKNELKRITDKKYISETNKKEIQVDRLMGKILSDKATILDFHNLFIGVAALASKFEVKQIDDKYCNAICNFVRNRIPAIGNNTSTYVSIPDEKWFANCDLKFNEKGHVILPPDQKKELLSLKKEFDNNLKPKDVELLKEGWDKFYETERGIWKVGVWQKDIPKELELSEKGSLDKPKSTTNYTIQCINKHPELKYNNDVKLNPEIQNANASMEIEQKKALMQDIKSAEQSVTTLKESWNAMKSHTLFFNSSEYSKMEKAFKNYINAYDNITSGKTVDGKVRANADSIESAEAAKLKDLQSKMQKAAKDYIAAKRAQKGGGIDKHSTQQGQDRLAMANALANFDLISKATTKEAEMRFNVDKNKKSYKKNVTLEQLEGSVRGRVNLQHNARKLREKDAVLAQDQDKKTSKKKL